MAKKYAVMLATRDQNEAVALMLLEKREAVHHPGIETVRGVASNFTHHMQPVFEPSELASRRGWKDRDLAVFAFIAVLRYGLVAESETSVNVVS